MITTKHILATVDLSDVSPRVIAYARHLSKAWQADLTVLHVVHDVAKSGRILMSNEPLSTRQHNLETEAHDHLITLCASVDDNEVLCQTMIATGRPSAEVHRIIRECGVDCLVIGAHYEDKPEHQLIGSTAERLLRQLMCPTIVVPPDRLVDFVSRS